MSARASMVHRAVCERNSAAGTDGWNNPKAPNWQLRGTVPCRAWTNAERQVVDGRKTAIVEDLRMMVPLGADLTERDRVREITDRSLDRPGNVLFAGPFLVRTVQRRADHLEVFLEGAA